MIQQPLTKNNSINRRISKKVVLYYLFFMLIFSLLVVLESNNNFAQNPLVYLGVWAGIMLIFTTFFQKFTFSAQLGRPLDIFEIPISATMMNLVLNSLAGINTVINPERLSHFLPSVAYIYYALLFVSFALLFIWIGYWFGIMLWRSSHRVTHKVSQRKWDFSNPALDRTIALYLILLAIRILLLIIGGGQHITGIKLGVWSQWIGYLISIRHLLFPLIILQVIRSKWPARLLITTTITETVMIFISGSSGDHISTIYLLVGAMLLYGKRLPWKSVVVAFVMIIFITPVTRTTRDILRDNPAQYDNVSTTYKDNVVETSIYYLQNPTKALEFTINFYLIRQGGIAQMPAILLVRVPSQVPYLPSSDLLARLLSFVPRVFWPGNKPMSGSIGDYYTKVVLDLHNIDAASAATLIGVPYLYGGLPLVMVDMFLIGLMAAILYATFAIPGISRGQVALYAVYLAIFRYNFILGDVSFLGSWQSVVQTTFVYLIVAIVLCIDTKPKQAHPSNE